MSAGSAQAQQLAPIPDMYLGEWFHHGASLDITRSDIDPAAGFVTAQWRTYSMCESSPPPCDRFIGHVLAEGGIASLVLQHTQGQDDRTVTAIVAATSDPTGYAWDETIQYTMLPGNMLLEVNSNGQSTMYCGANTDLSLYPPNPCGA
jgi:hypothetical protein